MIHMIHARPIHLLAHDLSYRSPARSLHPTAGIGRVSRETAGFGWPRNFLADRHTRGPMSFPAPAEDSEDHDSMVTRVTEAEVTEEDVSRLEEFTASRARTLANTPVPLSPKQEQRLMNVLLSIEESAKRGDSNLYFLEGSRDAAESVGLVQALRHRGFDVQTESECCYGNLRVTWQDWGADAETDGRLKSLEVAIRRLESREV